MPDLVYMNYNGVNAFAPQPTPLIALEEQNIYVNELWGRQETFTLRGQLTGCTYADIVAAQSTLLSRFNKSYQTLEVFEQTGNVSTKVFQKDLVEIRSIEFEEGKWWGVLPYTMTLVCYPSGLFSGAFGILNPSDTWNFVEGENMVLSATHTISCQPFNTSSGPSNALTNARNWAFGRTGIGSLISPILISGVSTENFCLLTQQETIDRFNGTYSLVENYTNDLTRSGYGVIRYTTDISSGNGLITVNLNGSAQGCNRNITGTRYAFSQIDYTAVATNAYRSVFNRNDLNPIPLTQSFDENPYTATIDFAYTYDNSNLPETWFDYTVNCSVGTNGFITTSIDGTVYARGGDTASKLSRAKAYASTVDLYNLCLPFYNGFDVSSSVAPLNPAPISNTQTNSETQGTVSLAATYTNSLQTSAVLQLFNANVNVSPARPVYDIAPILDSNGLYSVVNLGYKTRTNVTINGNAIVNRSFAANAGIFAVKSAAYDLFSRLIPGGGTLTQNTVTTSRTDERIIDFSFSWTCPGNGGITLN